MGSLSIEDLEAIQESLKYTILKFEDYQGYPSYEFKQKRIEDIRTLSFKVNGLIQELKRT